MPFKWSTGYLLGNTIDFSYGALTLRISTVEEQDLRVSPAGETLRGIVCGRDSEGDCVRAETLMGYVCVGATSHPAPSESFRFGP